MLEKKFYILCQKITNNNKLIKILWKEIELSYSNTNRFYHTLSHLENIYSKLKPFPLNSAIEFSIFYHDMVYDIQKVDNEEKSAVVALKHLTELGLTKRDIKQVYQLIIKTKSYQASSLENALFLDADLSILGSKLEVYKKYSENIRQEYSIYSDKVYKNGRKNVLEKFLTKDRIYISDYFYDLYEKKARKNIEYELKYL